jgi:hypothetical protein
LDLSRGKLRNSGRNPGDPRARRNKKNPPSSPERLSTFLLSHRRRDHYLADIQSTVSQMAGT